MKRTKYIFVVGGVMSGVGKGIASASVGKILQNRGLSVTAVKIDPYINVDAGTMNPVEHGEVFVTEDGDETDQDIGNYERFLDTNIFSDNYMTTGRVYQTVISKERNLGYDGKCVEVVPHIPQEIIRRIKKAGNKADADVVIAEVGGTVGEYQNILFLEAARMMHLKNPEDVLFMLVTYLPVPSKIGEMKTKPTQTAARTLNSAGIQPDFILCRSAYKLDTPRKEKIATFCNIEKADIISAPDVDSVYEVPLNFEKEKLGDRIMEKFKMRRQASDWNKWKSLVKKSLDLDKTIKVGIIGKYFATGDFILSDSYISVIESIKYAAWSLNIKPEICWLDSNQYEKNKQNLVELKNYDCLVVPGGFGSRGIEGKINAIGYARENKIPYLGLCYGMQLASIEFARNVCNIKDADTEERKPAGKNNVIHIMPDQAIKLAKKQYGNTMRLGAYPCKLKNDSIVFEAYNSDNISERHRHRYEFNNKYRQTMQNKGLVFSGVSPDDKLVEIVELPRNVHPYFVGVQFHPEFKSRPLKPHPLFVGLIKAAIK